MNSSRTGFSLSVFCLPGKAKPDRLKSLCGNSKWTPFCSARLQAGTLESSRCPPEGGRYMIESGVLTQPLNPVLLKGLPI
jgi:hypothetical protein